ncbi:hypothetical protein COBT_002067 [Conglomerata obtusa]
MIDNYDMLIENENEADAILGLLSLKYDGNIGKKRDANYKYKTDFQLKMLKEVYKITQYPSTDTRTNIGILLDMQPRSIQIWFQNMRQTQKDDCSKENSSEISLKFIDTCIKNVNDETQLGCYSQFLTKKIYNGQYLSYDVSCIKLIDIFLELKKKESLYVFNPQQIELNSIPNDKL